MLAEFVCFQEPVRSGALAASVVGSAAELLFEPEEDEEEAALQPVSARALTPHSGALGRDRASLSYSELMQGRIVLWVLLAVAVVMVVVGAGVLLFAPASFGTFGFFSGANATSFDFSGMYPVTLERAAGAACCIAGLLIVAAVLGWIFGRRSALSAGVHRG
ncbi:hypothetical protein [Leifsonia sp. NPDC058248]|uniref:hypothetical protein n=1 Tax=Leifsonia sp. NPDC058248 TaxID=3346402 RepID=UPI0036D95BA6